MDTPPTRFQFTLPSSSRPLATLPVNTIPLAYPPPPPHVDHSKIRTFPANLTHIGKWPMCFFPIGILIGTGAVITALRNDTAELELLEFIQVLEAGMNDVVLIGAAIFFVVTLEVRAKHDNFVADVIAPRMDVPAVLQSGVSI